MNTAEVRILGEHPPNTKSQKRHNNLGNWGSHESAVEPLTSHYLTSLSIVAYACLRLTIEQKRTMQLHFSTQDLVVNYHIRQTVRFILSDTVRASLRIRQ